MIKMAFSVEDVKKQLALLGLHEVPDSVIEEFIQTRLNAAAEFDDMAGGCDVGLDDSSASLNTTNDGENRTENEVATAVPVSLPTTTPPDQLSTKDQTSSAKIRIPSPQVRSESFDRVPSRPRQIKENARPKVSTSTASSKAKQVNPRTSRTTSSPNAISSRMSSSDLKVHQSAPNTSRAVSRTPSRLMASATNSNIKKHTFLVKNGGVTASSAKIRANAMKKGQQPQPELEVGDQPKEKEEHSKPENDGIHDHSRLRKNGRSLKDLIPFPRNVSKKPITESVGYGQHSTAQPSDALSSHSSASVLSSSHIRPLTAFGKLGSSPAQRVVLSVQDSSPFSPQLNVQSKFEDEDDLPIHKLSFQDDAPELLESFVRNPSNMSTSDKNQPLPFAKDSLLRSGNEEKYYYEDLESAINESASPKKSVSDNSAAAALPFEQLHPMHPANLAPPNSSPTMLQQSPPVLNVSQSSSLLLPSPDHQQLPQPPPLQHLPFQDDPHLLGGTFPTFPTSYNTFGQYSYSVAPLDPKISGLQSPQPDQVGWYPGEFSQLVGQSGPHKSALYLNASPSAPEFHSEQLTTAPSQADLQVVAVPKTPPAQKAKRRPNTKPRKTDPVARFHRFREQWSKDKFLRRGVKQGWS
mmetsp:Transcript_37091/g.72860  ORF Transcript_37091/g.72860 Transcript_37091/m.72860 type:complete len:636 (+) Transcript_37091:3-1910(+)